MTDKNYIYTPLAEPTPISEQVWPEGTIPLVELVRLHTITNPLYVIV